MEVRRDDYCRKQPLVGSLQRDKVEPKEYVGVQSPLLGKMKELYRQSPSLMELVVSKKNLLSAAAKVRRNKGAAGIDGMTVWEVEEHI